MLFCFLFRGGGRLLIVNVKLYFVRSIYFWLQYKRDRIYMYMYSVSFCLIPNYQIMYIPNSSTIFNGTCTFIFNEFLKRFKYTFTCRLLFWTLPWKPDNCLRSKKKNKQIIKTTLIKGVLNFSKSSISITVAPNWSYLFSVYHTYWKSETYQLIRSLTCNYHLRTPL